MKCYVLCLRHCNKTGYELSADIVTTDKDKAVAVYDSYIKRYGKYGHCDGQELQEWNENGDDYVVLMST